MIASTLGRRSLAPVVLVGALMPAACGDGGPFWPQGEPPIRTHATSYLLESDGSLWSTRLGITYENRGTEIWFLPNCNGLYSWWLERRVGEETWEAAFGPILPLCLSPSIRVQPGETMVDWLQLVAGQPDTNIEPKFDAPNPEGTYRIVVETVSCDPYGDAACRPWDEVLPLEQRISNAFELRLADPPEGGG